MYRAPRAWAAMALCTISGTMLGGCDAEDPPVVIEETDLTLITATARSAQGPLITADVRAYQLVDNFFGGSGGVLGDLQDIRLDISETFYSTGRMILNTGLSSFAGTRKTQVYEGLGTIRWSQPAGDGTLPSYRSVTALTMTMEYTVGGSPEELSCYDPDATDDWDEVVCATIKGTMYNPFPDRRPEIEITGKSTDPIRQGEDPANFRGYDVVLRTRRPQGLVAYRHPAIYTLPVARDFVGTTAALDRLRVRAAIDRGSVTIQQVGLYYSSVPALNQSDFPSAGFTTVNPYTGLVEKCVLGVQLGGSPGSPFLGTLRYFWHVAFSVSGASDEIQSGLAAVPVGGDLNENVTPAVFSPGCQ